MQESFDYCIQSIRIFSYSALNRLFFRGHLSPRWRLLNPLTVKIRSWLIGQTQEKKNWGNGPWQSEPDFKYWSDNETGRHCVAIRHPSLGHWCGYVGLDVDHWRYGADASDLSGVEAHGGITYSNFLNLSQNCITKDEDLQGVWFVGFDCCHLYDVSPGGVAMMRAVGMGDSMTFAEGAYRTLEYVVSECSKLSLELDRPDQIEPHEMYESDTPPER